MDALQRAVPVPQHEIVMRRALRRQVLRQRLPLAAGGTARRRSRSALRARSPSVVARRAAPAESSARPAPIRRRSDHSDNEGRPVGGKAVFGLPHRALLGESSAHKGITTDSSELNKFFGSALRVDENLPAKVVRSACTTVSRRRKCIMPNCTRKAVSAFAIGAQGRRSTNSLSGARRHLATVSAPMSST